MVDKQFPQPYLRGDRGDVFYFTYTDRAGHRRTRSTGSTTKKDARAFIREYLARQESGTAVTFQQYAAPFFLPGQCPREARLRPERKNYGMTHMHKSRDVLKRYVLTDPVFPELAMNEIRRRDVLDLRARLMERLPEKPNTAGKALGAAKTVLSEAEYREDIDSNPGRGVALPAYDHVDRGAFAIDEVRAILAQLPDLVATDKARVPAHGRRPRMEALFTALFLAGLRVGEARAWRWEDIDMERRQFRVVRAVKDSAGTIGDPKWDKPRTGLALPDLLHAALGHWRARLNPLYADLVFPDVAGGPISTTVIRVAWARLLTHAAKHDKVKLDVACRWLTPHSTRHTLNTHLLAARVPPLDVQLYLGWQSSIGKTLTRVQEGYTDMRLLDTSRVACAIDEIYRTDPAREIAATS